MATKDLDFGQVIKQVYDPATESLQTVPGSATSFEIELSADDGDSVETRGITDEQSATGLDNTATGVVLAEFDISGMSSINMYSKTTTNIVGAQVLTLEISPTTTGDVWAATSLTITPDVTAPNVVAGTSITDVVARRARVSTAAAITSGVYDLYVVAKGN